MMASKPGPITHWIVTADQARARGDIGIFYPVSRRVEAPDAETAVTKYREIFETLDPPRATPTRAPEAGR